MNNLIAEGRSLSMAILLPVTAIFAVMLVMVLRRTTSRVTQYLVFALWLRWILSAYHDITYKDSPVGLSWNALGSVLIIGLGLMIIKSRKVLDPVLVPFYPVFAAIIMSGALNNEWSGTIDMMVKYTYLMVLTLAIVDALKEVGDEKFTKLALWPFFILLGLQALSIVLGAAKASERDGSVSYIGGYNHEAAYSIALSAGLLLVCMGKKFGAFTKGALIIACYAAIYLANYRTAILAMTPMVGIAAVVGITRRFVPSQRLLVGGLMAVVVGFAGLGGYLANQDRFGEIGVALQQGSALIKPRQEFSQEDRRFMSARPYIWSFYLISYSEGTPRQKAFGFGPSSWAGKIPVYAHNTIVSYIYEIGAVGVAAVLFFWAWMFGLAIAVRGVEKWMLIAGHASFFLFNMATMPLWNIEGLIFYALLCGFTVSKFQSTRQRLASKSASPIVPAADVAQGAT